MAVIEGLLQNEDEDREIPPCPPGFLPHGWAAWQRDKPQMEKDLPWLFGKPGDKTLAPVIEEPYEEEDPEIPPCPPAFRPRAWAAWHRDRPQMEKDLPSLFGRR